MHTAPPPAIRASLDAQVLAFLRAASAFHPDGTSAPTADRAAWAAEEVRLSLARVAAAIDEARSLSDRAVDRALAGIDADSRWCPGCEGTGSIDGPDLDRPDVCPVCAGTGTLPTKHTDKDPAS